MDSLEEVTRIEKIDILNDIHCRVRAEAIEMADCMVKVAAPWQSRQHHIAGVNSPI